MTESQKDLAEQVEASATRIERAATAVEDTTDRSTQLAADRTVLAGERTYAAWVRTALAALIAGIGARAFLSDSVPPLFAETAGSLLVLFSAFCLVAGLWREMHPGAPPPETDVHRLPTWVLLVANGVLMLVALIALIGIWRFRA